MVITQLHPALRWRIVGVSTHPKNKKSTLFAVLNQGLSSERIGSSGGWNTYILNLCTRWTKVTVPRIPVGRAPGTRRSGGWVVPRAGPDVVWAAYSCCMRPSDSDWRAESYTTKVRIWNQCFAVSVTSDERSSGRTREKGVELTVTVVDFNLVAEIAQSV
jgi:hypothetical protein